MARAQFPITLLTTFQLLSRKGNYTTLKDRSNGVPDIEPVQGLGYECGMILFNHMPSHLRCCASLVVVRFPC